MFRWCAYCMEFLGEREPLEDLSPTHGMCSDCATRDSEDEREAIRRIQPVLALHRDLLHVAERGDRDLFDDVIQRARTLGVRPTALLIGVLQPAMYVVGQRWMAGTLDPPTEARFTSFCESALDALELEQRERRPRTTGRCVLLGVAEGNTHAIGVRMVGFVLRERGFDARLMPTSPSIDWLARMCPLLRPRLVGFSVSHPDQLAFVERACVVVRANDATCEVCVGGIGLLGVTVLPSGVSRLPRIVDVADWLEHRPA